MLATLYRGSVKDLKGPLKIDGSEGILFDYSDAYSVFDWGRMPDLLAQKGEALAVLAAEFFERLEKPAEWQEFSKSSEALGLRKGNRFGSAFIELGEGLQREGLRTHYLGAVPQAPKPAPKPEKEPSECAPLSAMGTPPRSIFVRQVAVAKPEFYPVLGRQVPDYSASRAQPKPRLVPLEVVFRFSCPKGSSLFERVERDPGYLAELGFAHLSPAQGAALMTGEAWSFPLLELFTKLEPSDRPVNLTEGLAISGLSARELQQLLFRTAWVAGFLRWRAARAGLELADGKLEWALTENGLELVDAIGPDELRILKEGVQLSKEFLRGFYRKTDWYAKVASAKRDASAQGTAEWKRHVSEGPPVLPPPYKEAAAQVYLALANELTGKRWFPEAWPLDRVVKEIARLQS